MQIRKPLKEFWQFFRSNNYWEFYQKIQEHSKIEKCRDFPKTPDWESHSHWQLQYLKNQGLHPSHRFLDYGCGTFRLGHVIVPWLQKHKYTGIDINPHFINLVRKEFSEIIRKNHVSLIAIQPNQFFVPKSYDFIWAQSVLTHIPPNEAESFFDSIETCLSIGGKALITFNNSHVQRETPTSFSYNEKDIRNYLSQTKVTNIDNHTGHPFDQSVLEIKRK